ncbi:metallophosphoesterase [Pirellulaceae bacterium SH467]
MTSVHFRLIGDVHGRMQERTRRADRDRDRRTMPAIWRDPRVRGRSYLKLVSDANYSMQVGDLSLDYTDLQHVDPKKHRAIAGNHDHLGRLTSHFLGDYGMHSIPLTEGELSFFFARGAESIDKSSRVEGLNWWHDEELNAEQVSLAIQLYEQQRPNMVVTHDCPAELVQSIATLPHQLPWSATNRFLQDLFDVHAPQWWFFGHHHRNWVFQHPRGTRFICLASLAHFDFDEDGRSISWKPE